MGIEAKRALLRADAHLTSLPFLLSSMPKVHFHPLGEVI
jgi:hypothetical protein